MLQRTQWKKQPKHTSYEWVMKIPSLKQKMDFRILHICRQHEFLHATGIFVCHVDFRRWWPVKFITIKVIFLIFNYFVDFFEKNNFYGNFIIYIRKIKGKEIKWRCLWRKNKRIITLGINYRNGFCDYGEFTCLVSNLKNKLEWSLKLYFVTHFIPTRHKKLTLIYFFFDFLLVILYF